MQKLIVLACIYLNCLTTSCTDDIKKADVILCVDTSVSIPEPLIHDIAKQIHDTILDISKRDDLDFQIGACSFNSEVQQIPLGTNYGEIADGVTKFFATSRSTATDLALHAIYDELYKATSRRDVCKIAVIFTDGYANDREKTLGQSKKLLSAGTKLVAIATGLRQNRVDWRELALMTNDSRLLFDQKDTHRVLYDYVISGKLCSHKSDKRGPRVDLMFFFNISQITSYIKDQLMNSILYMVEVIDMHPTLGFVLSVCPQILDVDTEIEQYYTRIRFLEVAMDIINASRKIGEIYIFNACAMEFNYFARANATKVAILYTESTLNTVNIGMKHRLFQFYGIRLIIFNVRDYTVNGFYEPDTYRLSDNDISKILNTIVSTTTTEPESIASKRTTTVKSSEISESITSALAIETGLTSAMRFMMTSPTTSTTTHLPHKVDKENEVYNYEYGDDDNINETGLTDDSIMIHDVIYKDRNDSHDVVPDNDNDNTHYNENFEVFRDDIYDINLVSNEQNGSHHDTDVDNLKVAEIAVENEYTNVSTSSTGYNANASHKIQPRNNNVTKHESISDIHVSSILSNRNITASGYTVACNHTDHTASVLFERTHANTSVVYTKSNVSDSMELFERTKNYEYENNTLCNITDQIRHVNLIEDNKTRTILNMTDKNTTLNDKSERHGNFTHVLSIKNESISLHTANESKEIMISLNNTNAMNKSNESNKYIDVDASSSINGTYLKINETRISTNATVDDALEELLVFNNTYLDDVSSHQDSIRVELPSNEGSSLPDTYRITISRDVLVNSTTVTILDKSNGDNISKTTANNVDTNSVVTNAADVINENVHDPVTSYERLTLVNDTTESQFIEYENSSETSSRRSTDINNNLSTNVANNPTNNTNKYSLFEILSGKHTTNKIIELINSTSIFDNITTQKSATTDSRVTTTKEDTSNATPSEHIYSDSAATSTEYISKTQYGNVGLSEFTITTSSEETIAFSAGTNLSSDDRETATSVYKFDHYDYEQDFGFVSPTDDDHYPVEDPHFGLFGLLPDGRFNDTDGSRFPVIPFPQRSLTSPRQINDSNPKNNDPRTAGLKASAARAQHNMKGFPKYKEDVIKETVVDKTRPWPHCDKPCEKLPVRGQPTKYHRRDSVASHECGSYTRYDNDSCECSSRVDRSRRHKWPVVIHKGLVCSPLLYLPFDKDIRDHSGQMSKLKVRGNIEIVHEIPGSVGRGVARFDGNAFIEVPRTVGKSAARIAVKLRHYTPPCWTRDDKPANLVVDSCDDANIDICTNANNTMLTLDGNRTVAVNTFGDWNDVVFSVDLDQVTTLAVNGISVTILSHDKTNSRALSSALKIGGGCGQDFVGYLDEVYVYECFSLALKSNPDSINPFNIRHHHAYGINNTRL